MTTEYRLHVLPRLRTIGGRVLLPNWLAITIGRDIICWRRLDEVELAHELAHVRQWDRYGFLFVARYARASWRATRADGHWYRDNAFEAAARAAATVREAEIAAREPATAGRAASAEGRHPGT